MPSRPESCEMRATAQRHLIRTHEPEHLGRQRAVGINAQLVCLGENCALTQVAEKRAVGSGQFAFIHTKRKIGHRHLNLLPGLIRDVFLETDIIKAVGHSLAFFIFPDPGNQPLTETALAHAQQRRERVRDYRLLVANQRWIGTNRFHGNARGQQVAVHVQNVAPSRRLEKVMLCVQLRHLGQFIMSQHLQVHEPITQPGERRAQ